MKTLSQCTGYFVAHGHRTQFFIANAATPLEAETNLYTQIEEHAQEMDCKNYSVVHDDEDVASEEMKLALS